MDIKKKVIGQIEIWTDGDKVYVKNPSVGIGMKDRSLPKSMVHKAIAEVKLRLKLQQLGLSDQEIEEEVHEELLNKAA